MQNSVSVRQCASLSFGNDDNNLIGKTPADQWDKSNI